MQLTATATAAPTTTTTTLAFSGRTTTTTIHVHMFFSVLWYLFVFFGLGFGFAAGFAFCSSLIRIKLTKDNCQYFPSHFQWSWKKIIEERWFWYLVVTRDLFLVYLGIFLWVLDFS